MKLKWRVLKNEDIADLKVIIRDKANPNNIIYEKILPYFKRSIEIDTKTTIKQNGNFQICLIAKDSKDINRGFYKEQCKEMNNKSSDSNKIYVNNVICFVLAILLYSAY